MRPAVLFTIAILTSCGGHLHAQEAKTRDSEVTEKSVGSGDPASQPVTRPQPPQQPVSGQRPEPEAALEVQEKESTAERCIMADPVQWAAQEVIWRREVQWHAFKKAIREARERRIQQLHQKFLQRHLDMRELRKLPRAEFLAAMKERSKEPSMNGTPYFLAAP